MVVDVNSTLKSMKTLSSWLSLGKNLVERLVPMKKLVLIMLGYNLYNTNEIENNILWKSMC